MDEARLARAVREILLAIGDDPDRDGLRGTPERVARSFAETCAGLHQDPSDHLARQFAHEAGPDDMVVLRNIAFASLCEHHLAPFLGRAHVAYLPAGGHVVGLSKLARTVETFARRPQLQERLTAEVADALDRHLAPRGVAVLIEAEHLCMRMRGVRQADTEMVTTAVRGDCATDRSLRREVMELLRGTSA